MKIQIRLLVLMLSKTTFTMLIALLITSYFTKNALEIAATEKLAAVLEARENALNQWMETLQGQMTILAVAPTTVRVLADLSAEFHNLGDNAQVRLQQNYRATNPAQPPQTQTSTAAYEQLHRVAYPYFMRRHDAYNWEDMFLIDTQGNVVFSLKKEADFATNLRTGPWQKTGLAHAVIPLLTNAVPNQLSFADYALYAPAKMQAASFIAMPVFDEQQQQFLGVVAIQLPIAKMTSLMIDKTGMGETGEVIVVGKDGWMLTDSRFSTDNLILKRQLKTQAVNSVLAGNTATLIAPDYLGIEVLATVKPITPFPSSLGDSVRWGIIAKVEYAEVLREYNSLQHVLLLTTLALIALAVGLGMWGASTLTRPLVRITEALTRLANGEQINIPELHRSDEIGAIAKAAETFHAIAQQIESEHWLSENIAILTGVVSTENSVNIAADRVLHLLCGLLNVPVGAIYLLNEAEQCYQRISTHGLARSNQADTRFELGVGLLGQCANSHQAIVLSPVPAGLTIISTGLAEFAPHELIIYPIEHKKDVLMVIELAATDALHARQHTFLKAATAALGLHFANLQAAEHNAVLLQETQQQADKLQRNNAEMQAISEELRSQSEEMKSQNEELKANQEELRAQQEETMQKNQLLKAQSVQLQEVIDAASDKAEELQRANQYKSEFLANMSHELRTPLNSILILSKNLAENEGHNLSTEQIESASVISESGAQLLTLINDILDLSKIEAGKLEINKEAFLLTDLTTYLRRVFLPQSAKKQLTFSIELAPNVPKTIYSDRQRLTQILSNLLTNAIKFTEEGGVKIVVSKVDDNLQIEIVDTGIGIPSDKLEHIFGAFQQLDGSISRKYGGSGLGLAISRHLAHLLDGDITVVSHIGTGSRFILRLSQLLSASVDTAPHQDILPIPVPPVVNEQTGGTILLVEDDSRLLAILGRMMTTLGFTPVTAESAERALELLPNTSLTGIFLDLGLPKMSGMDLLRQLKANSASAHIPVFIMSAAIDTGEATALGARGFLEKPVTRDNIIAALKIMVQLSQTSASPTILFIEDNAVDRQFVTQLLKDCPVSLVVAKTGQAALHQLQQHTFAAVILDLHLPDMSGFEWLKHARQHLNPPPIIIYSARELSENEVFQLKGVTQSIVTKDALSDRLRAEVLHALQKPTESKNPVSVPSTGKRLLLVDDDARNLFALTKALKSKGFAVEVAPDAQTALTLLAQSPFDALLTDIMMPEVDGYTLIRRVRALGYDKLPIVAVTAKAMQGDDTLCLQAGANAYLAKPVDVYTLIELLNKNFW